MPYSGTCIPFRYVGTVRYPPVLRKFHFNAIMRKGCKLFKHSNFFIYKNVIYFYTGSFIIIHLPYIFSLFSIILLVYYDVFLQPTQRLLFCPGSRQAVKHPYWIVIMGSQSLIGRMMNGGLSLADCYMLVNNEGQGTGRGFSLLGRAGYRFSVKR